MSTQPAEWVDFHVNATWECHHCATTGFATDRAEAVALVTAHLRERHANVIVGEAGRP